MRALIILFTFISGSAVQGAGTDRPNVLFLAVDDLNDWVGCLRGHPQAQTPNIDRLAARGILFTNAHCAAPACNPSRASLFTGQMPEKTGVWANRGPKLTETRPDAVLLPSAFSAAGYRTMGTGKLGPDKRCWAEFQSIAQRWSPLSRDEVAYTEAELPSKGSDNPRHVVGSDGRPHVLPLNRMPSDRRPKESSGESFDWGAWDVADREFGDTMITNWAIEKIQKKSGSPIFLGGCRS